MEFEFQDSIYVEESELREMFLLCRDKELSPEEAFLEVSSGWDDGDYYKRSAIMEDVVKEINRRLEQSKKNKS